MFHYGPWIGLKDNYRKTPYSMGQSMVSGFDVPFKSLISRFPKIGGTPRPHPLLWDFPLMNQRAWGTPISSPFFAAFSYGYPMVFPWFHLPKWWPRGGAARRDAAPPWRVSPVWQRDLQIAADLHAAENDAKTHRKIIGTWWFEGE